MIFFEFIFHKKFNLYRLFQVQSGHLNKMKKKEILENAKDLIFLQNYLFEVKDNNEKGAIEWIIQSRFASDPLTFLRTISKATMIRPENIQNHSNIVIEYSKRTKLESEIKELLLKKLLLNCQRLILYLAKDRFITPKEIADAVISIDEPDISLFAYFEPEIENFYSEYSSYIHDIDPNSKHLEKWEKQFIAGFERYQYNDWELLNQRRFHNYEIGSLERIIADDDLENFQVYLKSGYYNPNYVIPHSLYTPTVYPFYDPTLIQFIALKRARKIYTFLESIDDRIDYGAKNQENLNVANFAVAGGDDEIISSLINKKNSNFYFGALQSAAKFHHNILFKKILNLVSTIDEKKRLLNDYGPLDTVLNCCVAEENIELLLFCLENKNIININQPGHNHFTPLHVALYYNVSPIITDILLCFADDFDFNQVDDRGLTPLMMAIQQRNHDFFNKLLLIKGGFEPNTNLYISNRVDFRLKDQFGRDALFLATDIDEEEIVKTLLSKNIYSLDEIDKFGQTVVHTAVYHNSIKSLRLLLDTELVDLTATDINGKTALDIAKEKNFQDAIRMLNSFKRKELESSDPYSSESESYNEYEEDEEEDESEEEESDIEVSEAIKKLNLLDSIKTEVTANNND